VLPTAGRDRSRRSVLRGGVTLGAALLGGALLSRDPTSGAPRGATTVRMWAWASGMNRYVAAFNAAQRDVYVELSPIATGPAGGYSQQSNAIRAHNAPDIMQVEYQALPQMMLTGGFRDLTADIADLEADCSPAAWQSVRPDGERTWAVPFDVAPMAFFHRKDLFDRAGIAVPTSWEEFAEAADAVRAADPSARISQFTSNDGVFAAGLGWGTGDRWWTIDGDAWQVGIDGSPTLRMAAFWQDLITTDRVALLNPGTQDWIAAMHDGRLWGLLGAAWHVGSLRRSIPDDVGRWAIATMPVENPAAPTNGMMGGSAYAVSAESEQVEAALHFLRWLAKDPAVPEIGHAVTLPFPAYRTTRDVARTTYEGNYFVGENVYDVLGRAETRVPPWTWGPNTLSVFSRIVDEIGTISHGTSYPDAMRRLQAFAAADMRARGLSVVEGDRS
jgi:multiple sugar transport system substrate-binding protein